MNEVPLAVLLYGIVLWWIGYLWPKEVRRRVVVGQITEISPTEVTFYYVQYPRGDQGDESGLSRKVFPPNVEVGDFMMWTMIFYSNKKSDSIIERFNGEHVPAGRDLLPQIRNTLNFSSES
jgi:hypothetical protein